MVSVGRLADDSDQWCYVAIRRLEPPGSCNVGPGPVQALQRDLSDSVEPRPTRFQPYNAPIPGTERDRLPAWMEPHRERLGRFVRFHSDAGMIPISDFKQIRIAFGDGLKLNEAQGGAWFKAAQRWQDLLLTEVTGKEHRNGDCVNNSGTTSRSNNSRSRQGGRA